MIRHANGTGATKFVSDSKQALMLGRVAWKAAQSGGTRDRVLFAIAGGSVGGEVMVFCCFFYLLLPLILVLTEVVVVRDSHVAAWLAFILATLPLIVQFLMTTEYASSDDWEVISDQAAGWNALRYYVIVTAVTGLLPLWVSRKWLKRVIVGQAKDES